MSNTAGETQVIYPPAYAVPARESYRGPSVAIGVFLVLLGGAFLAARLTPGVSLWTLWPLAIVAAGIVQILVPSRWQEWGIERVSDGVGTVFLGVLLLGNTTGYIGWEMWFTALTLWPVLLVSAGIGLLGKAAGQSWIRALAPTLIWAALLFSAASAWNGAPLPTAILVQLGLQ